MTAAAGPPRPDTPTAGEGARRRALRRGRLALAWAIGATLGFAALLALVLLGDARAFDLRVTLALQRWRSPALLRLMVAASWPGFQPQAAIIAGALVAVLLAARLRLEGGFAALALLAHFLDGPLKLLAARPRPSAALDGVVVHGVVGGASFPSGHVLTYTVVGGYVAYLAFTLPRSAAARRIAVVPPLAFVALVGPSRVYLGQHWCTDVLASYLLGSALLIALLAAYRRAKGRQPARSDAGAAGARRGR